MVHGERVRQRYVEPGIGQSVVDGSGVLDAKDERGHHVVEVVQLAAQADGVATLDRLLPARPLLSSIGLGAWDHDCWYEPAATVLEALGRQDTPPREAEAALGSIAAVGLALMRTRTPRSDRGSGAAWPTGARSGRSSTYCPPPNRT